MTSHEGHPTIIEAADRFRAHRDDHPAGKLRAIGGTAFKSGVIIELPVPELTRSIQRVESDVDPEYGDQHLRDSVAETIYNMSTADVLKVAAFIQEERFNA